MMHKITRIQEIDDGHVFELRIRGVDSNSNNWRVRTFFLAPDQLQEMKYKSNGRTFTKTGYFDLHDQFSDDSTSGRYRDFTPLNGRSVRIKLRDIVSVSFDQCEHIT